MPFSPPGGHDLFDAASPVANRRDGIVTTLIRATEVRDSFLTGL